MKPITYSMQFRGGAGELIPGELELETVLTAPSSALVTTIGSNGVVGRLLPSPGGAARCVSRVSLATDGSFERSGRISFGRGNALWFQTIGRGSLTQSRDPQLRHATAMCEITGGEGSFEGASGRITCNLLVSTTGDVTDNQLGIVFLNHDETSRPT